MAGGPSSDSDSSNDTGGVGQVVVPSSRFTHASQAREERQRTSKSKANAQLTLLKCPVCASSDDAEFAMVVCDDTTGLAHEPNARAYHIACLGLEAVPDGDWFCPECIEARQQQLNQYEIVAIHNKRNQLVHMHASGCQNANSAVVKNGPAASRCKQRCSKTRSPAYLVEWWGQDSFGNPWPQGWVLHTKVEDSDMKT